MVYVTWFNARDWIARYIWLIPRVLQGLQPCNGFFKNNKIKREMNVFQLSQEHYDIMSLLEEMEGDMTPELQERYDQLMVAGEEKVKNLYWIHKHLSGQQAIIESEEKRIDALKKSNAKRLVSIKEMMNAMMKMLSLNNIKEGTINVIMAKHTEFVYDETKVPEGYFDKVEMQKLKLAEFKAWCKDNKESAEALCDAKFIEGNRIQIK